MTVDHTIDSWELLEHLAMDEALRVALLCAGVDSRAVGDVVFDQVFRRRDDCRGHVAAHDIHIALFGVPYRNVAVCVDDIVVVEDVVCCDELAAELFKLRFPHRDSRRRLTVDRSDIFVSLMVRPSKWYRDPNGSFCEDHEIYSSSPHLLGLG
jgi:hypothetical protein